MLDVDADMDRTCLRSLKLEAKSQDDRSIWMEFDAYSGDEFAVMPTADFERGPQSRAVEAYGPPTFADCR